MDEWIQMVANIGFPIAMCVYLMTRFEKTINKHTEAIESLIEYLKLKGGVK